MPPLSRLGRQIQEVRATRDVDLLVDEAHAGALDRELQGLGYLCVHRSDDAGNYLRGDERVDLLYAHRPIARRLLESAKPLDTPFGEIRVVSLEGLIAFKLQGVVNDPRRAQDLEDIRAPLVANGGVRSDVEPAADGLAALDDLMSVIEALCPTWPPRENSGSMPDMRL